VGSILFAEAQRGWSLFALSGGWRNHYRNLHCWIASNGQEKTMPQSTHDRIAELHSLAEHAHAAAAEAHGKGEHLSAHELSKRALEHSMNAYKLSAQQMEEAEKTVKS
jgi:hypothetical protein